MVATIDTVEGTEQGCLFLKMGWLDVYFWASK